MFTKYSDSFTQEELELLEIANLKRRQGKKHLLTTEEKEVQKKYTHIRRAANPIRQLFISCKNNAKKRGIEFKLTYDYFHSLVVHTPYCPVLGIPLVYEYSGGGGKSGCRERDNVASVDRIDNNKGYVKGNVWVISCRANLVKNDSTFDEIENMYYALKARRDLYATQAESSRAKIHELMVGNSTRDAISTRSLWNSAGA